MVHRQAEVAEVTPEGLVLADGTHVAGLVVWAGGFRAPPLAAEAGLEVDPLGRARVDATLQVHDRPDVLVAGDAAAVEGRDLRFACSVTMPLGAHAADVLLARLRGAPPAPLSFGFPGQHVSLGRRRGVVQLTDAHDRPVGPTLGGRPAAWVKELVCRYTWWSMLGERRLPGSYRWRPGAHQPQDRPALASSSQARSGAK